MAAPEEYGGSGLGLTEMCIVGEELSAVCVSTAATLLHQADLVVPPPGPPRQRRAARPLLPGLCDGSLIGCLAMTEPEAGSDVMSMRTRATPRGRRIRAERREDLHHQRARWPTSRWSTR